MYWQLRPALLCLAPSTSFQPHTAMSLYVIIRIIHSSCAMLSILGFAGRGYLKFSTGEVPQRFVFKVLPHVIDTVLLISAITLVVMSGQYPFVSSWVTAKVIVLFLYICLGILLMRLKVGKATRGALYAVALFCGVYMILVALTKNPMPL